MRSDAGVCTRCARTRRKWLWDFDVGERNRCVGWCPAGRDVWTSLTPRKIALGGVWLFSAAMLALAFTKSFPIALALLFAAGFGMLLFFSTSNTVLQTIVPDEMRGRVMGVWSVVFGAMIPLGSLEAGAVAHFVGTPFALAFGAIICAASALVTLCVVRRREAQLAK